MPSSAARAVRRANSARAAEVGVQRRVPAGLAADRPGAARVGAARGRGVVAALAVRQPDRVHGRQVEHVEAELRELRQELLDAGEAAPGAREELVPGAVGRALAVDQDLERLLGDDLLGAVAGGCGEAFLDGQRRARPAARRPPRARSRARSARPRPCARARAARRRRGRPTRPRRTASARAHRPRTSRASGRGPRGCAASAARASGACPATGSARRRRAPRARRAGTWRRPRRRSPSGAFDGIATAVDLRPDALDADAIGPPGGELQPVTSGNRTGGVDFG